MKFTVIAKCLCGCGEAAEVHHVEAPDHKQAAAMVKKETRPIEVIIVLHGHAAIGDEEHAPDSAEVRGGQ